MMHCLRNIPGRAVRAAALLLLPASLSLLGDVPDTLNFQGRLLVDGIPFTGTGQFKFALIDVTDTIVWRNAPDASPADGQPDAAVSFAVTKGLYDVMLGEGMDPLPAALFTAHGSLRLRVWFDDGAHGFQALSPDQRLASVAYARRSASAETADSARLAQSLTGNATFSGNSVFTGRVGVGTDTPTAALDVQGGLKITPAEAGGGVSLIATGLPVGYSLSGPQGEGVLGLAVEEGNWSLDATSGDVVLGTRGNSDAKLLLQNGDKRSALAIRHNKVGIGTTDPATALEVSGTVRAAAFEGDGSHLRNVVAKGLEASHASVLRPDQGTWPAKGPWFSGWWGREIWIGDQVAQTFRPGVSGRLVEVGFYAAYYTSPGTLVVDLIQGEGLTGPVLASQALDIVSATDERDREGHFYEVSFASMPLVVESAIYTLVLRNDGTSEPIYVSGSRGVDAYPNGRRLSHGTWYDDDLEFYTYVNVDWEKVGIGSASYPSATLEIDSPVGPGAALVRTADPEGAWLTLATRNDVTNEWSFIATGPQNSQGPGSMLVYDKQEGAVRLLIDPAGRVGIGTTSPQALLDVQGDAQVHADLSVLGKVGIGTTSPTTSLDVGGDTRIRSNLGVDGHVGIGVINPDAPLSIRRDRANANFGYCIALNDHDGTPWWKIGAANGGRFSIGAAGLRDYDIAVDRGSGNVGIGNVPYGNRKLRVAGDLGVDGTGYASGGFHQSSDARLKTDVSLLTDALTRIGALRGVTFEWRPDPTNHVRPTGRQLGFLAQEVVPVLPELVHTNADGYLSVNYNGVTPVLVEAVKVLKQEFETRLAEKDAEIEALQTRLSQVEAALTRLAERASTPAVQSATDRHDAKAL